MDSRFLDKSVICAVFTPFQLVSAVLLFSMPENRCFKTCDLLLYGSLASNGEIAEKLKASDLFSSVIVADQLQASDSPTGVRSFLCYTFKDMHTEEQLYICCPELRGAEYDILCCTAVTSVSLDLLRYVVVRGGESIFFDDGVGSHTGAVFKLFSCFDDALSNYGQDFDKHQQLRHIVKKVAKPIIGSYFTFHVKELWLLSPVGSDFENFNDSIDVREIRIPDDKDALFDLLASDDGSEGRLEYRYVFLTLPPCDSATTVEEERKLFKTIEGHLGAQLAVKTHPRRTDGFPYLEQSNYIDNQTPWEIKLLQGVITDETVLFGFASTAMLTPKSVVGVEPTVCFLQNLLSQDVVAAPDAHKLIETMAASYSDPNKVVVPETWEDLSAFLSSL